MRKQHKIRSPLKLQGGKGVLRGHILQLFPPHRVYVEPFGGGASVLLGKVPCEVEVYNDLDPRPVSLFRVLKDIALCHKLQQQLWLTPYSREERERCRVGWNHKDDLVTQAHTFLVHSRQSFGGLLDRTSWGFVTTTTTAGMAQPISSYQSMIKMLPAIHNRLQTVLVKNEDWSTVLDRYDGPEVLFYLDPPYVTDTRRDGWFCFEMTDQDHEKLASRIVQLRGKVVLSGYPHALYDRLTQQYGWRKVEFTRACGSVARTKQNKLTGSGAVNASQKRLECVWLSPNCQ